MLLSHSHKFIYIHIQKPGGSSVLDALWPYIVKDEAYAHKKSDAKYFSYGPLHGGYHSCADLIKKYPGYFTFAFVRNPWERAFGYYWFDKKYFPRRLRHGGFYEYCRAHMGQPQTSWVTVGGKIAVDFLGKYESLEDDYLKACELIGIDDPPKLQHINKNPIKPDMDYREFFDDNAKDVIYKIHKGDIKRFGYEF